ncbi:hypothetical protein QE320_gp117 [Pseudomonas phage EM]|uniref:Uncharacterized protein n=1 Tax=Pseudomonas phage EM TaxID=2936914 RepID=A0AAE9HLZ2_9CAUD|nr:hypothetical protein QE320_gp117 [Pseudomonas phage EM]UPW35937.1 hypothetical protein EM_152 [Pseudomonas phage EM]
MNIKQLYNNFAVWVSVKAPLLEALVYWMVFASL